MNSEAAELASMAFCMMLLPAIGTFFAFYFANEASNQAKLDDSEMGQEHRRRATVLTIVGVVLLVITLGMCTCAGLMGA
jgi:hypothetical protein